jgi:predicted SAM-dependent methyltransferase
MTTSTPASPLKTRCVLNVGGGSSNIGLPPYYATWRQDRLYNNPAYNPDVLMDARNLGTLPAGTNDAIYCSHNLEHYQRHDAVKVIQGFAHVLKPEGFAEVLVPDLLWVMREVLQRNLDIDDVLYLTPDKQLPILVRDVLYGYHVEIEQSNNFFAHKTGFSPASLTRIFHENGFPVSAVGAKHLYEVSAYFFKQPPPSDLLTSLGIRRP